MARPDLAQNLGQAESKSVSIVEFRSIRWGIGEDYKLRWRKGPQFGVRQVTLASGIDSQGNEHPIRPAKYGKYTWYNILGQRVEGPEETGPVISMKLDYTKGIGSMTVNADDKPDSE